MIRASSILRIIACALQDVLGQSHHDPAGMFHVFQILMPWTDASRMVHQHVGRFVDGILEQAPVLDAGAFDAQYPWRRT